MKHKNFLGTVIGAFFLLAIVPMLRPSYAATLKFDPSSVNANTDDTFDIDIVVDAEDKEVLGVDALLEYDSSILTIDSITDGTYLEVGQKEFSEAGKAYVAGVVASPGESVTGEGVLATITFKALAAGTSDIKYICETGETNESNVSENSTDAPDLIQCALNGDAIVIVDGEAPVTTPQPTPSTLPRSGVFDDFLIYAILGGVLFIIGVGSKTLIRF